MRRQFARPILVAALSIAALMAQRHGSDSATTDPAAAAQRRVTLLTRLLSLTTAQVTQETTIYTNAATATATLETTLSQDRQSLRTAVRSNSTATIDQLSTTIGSLTGQITDIENKAD